MFEKGKILFNISNSDYHKQHSVKDHFFSSSQVKTMLKDPELFHRKYITRVLSEDKRNPAFDIGTYFHTAILEPDLLEKECAVWKGGNRGSIKYKEFEKANKDKAIITLAELGKANALIKGIEDSDVCLDMIDHENSTYEGSLFMDLMGVQCKVRFDVLNLGKDYSFIGDLKSTTGNPKDGWGLRTKIHNYGYDVSAAFYVDMINEYITVNKLDLALVEDFWLYFATKDYPMAKAWKMSPDMLAVGRAKYRKALKMLKKYQANGWKFEEETGVLHPLPWEKSDWIDGSEEDDLL